MFDRSRLARRVAICLAGVLIAWILTGLGCLSTECTVNVASLNPPDRLLVSQAGEIEFERAIESGSKDEQVITRWLHAHETGWRLDFNTYVPVHQIKGDRFNLNFVGRTCVMNYALDDKSDRWVQVSRTVEESDTLPELFGR